jgi:hypothetical protein
MRRVKILGERNSGTNLIRQMFARNTDVFLWPGTLRELGEDHTAAVERHVAANGFGERDASLLRDFLIDDLFNRHFDRSLGWKHAAPAVDRLAVHPLRHETVFVVISKSPYAWLLSMHRRPYHNVLQENIITFSTFLRRPWLTVRRDNAPAVLDNPIALWNHKYRACMTLARAADVVFVRYEDILEDPASLFVRVGVPTHPGRPLDIPTVSLKGDGVRFEGYRKMYSERFWLDRIDAEDVALIDRTLDPELLRLLGYVD